MKVLYFFYQWLIFVPLLVIISIIASLATSIGCLIGNKNFWGYWPGVIWARCIVRLSLCPVTVEGRENIDKNTEYVFVANHQGAFDIFLLFGFLGHDFRWMLRKGLRKIVFVGAACERAGHIYVDSHGSSGMMHTIRQALATLKEGHSLIIFPEGTRSNDGHLGTFKKGAFTLAAMLKVPVVPLTIEGPYKVLQKGSWLVHPHHLKLTIHKPLEPVSRKEGTDAGVDRLLHESQRVIAESLGEPVQE